MTDTDKLLKTRLNLIIKYPFYGSIASQVPTKVKEDLPFPAATNGRVIFFHPDTIDNLTCEELSFVIAHEIDHIILMHGIRQNERDSLIWNIACDYNINHRLYKYNIGAVPQKLGTLLDNKYEGMLEENIYDELIKDAPQIDIKDLVGVFYNSDGNGNEQEDQKPLTNQEIINIQHKIKDMIAEGIAKEMQKAGKLPRYVTDFAEDLLKPKVDWRSELRKFIMPIFPKMISWSKLNKRMISQKMYFPSVIKDGVGEIAVAIDTSGSVSDPIVNQFISELSSILTCCMPDKLHALFFDAAVHNYQLYEQDFEIKPVGGLGRGGTSFHSVLNYIKDSNGSINPRCIVILTDMYANLNLENLGIPILWISTTKNIKGPFGETIYIEC